ncbi:podocan isoform X1 [Babesia caballi]|uniref:Podocan isoform X1 n=1 Tax=Babesia caballi TaxID=5871 RepID=A0AAV4LTQ8_BABCB|nr:podocan isoform X1 [Babesia caballi]
MRRSLPLDGDLCAARDFLEGVGNQVRNGTKGPPLHGAQGPEHVRRVALAVVPRREDPLLNVERLELAGVGRRDDRVPEEQILTREAEHPRIAEHLLAVEAAVEEDAGDRGLAVREENVALLEEARHVQLPGLEGLPEEIARVVGLEDVPACDNRLLAARGVRQPAGEQHEPLNGPGYARVQLLAALRNEYRAVVRSWTDAPLVYLLVPRPGRRAGELEHPEVVEQSALGPVNVTLRAVCLPPENAQSVVFRPKSAYAEPRGRLLALRRVLDLRPGGRFDVVGPHVVQALELRTQASLATEHEEKLRPALWLLARFAASRKHQRAVLVTRQRDTPGGVAAVEPLALLQVEDVDVVEEALAIEAPKHNDRVALLDDGDVGRVALPRHRHVTGEGHRLGAEVHKAHDVRLRKVDPMRVPVAATEQVGATADADERVPVERAGAEGAPDRHPARLLQQHTRRRRPYGAERVLLRGRICRTFAVAEVAADGAEDVLLGPTRKVRVGEGRRLDPRRRRCGSRRRHGCRGLGVGGALVRPAQVEGRLDAHEPVLVGERHPVRVRLELLDHRVQHIVTDDGADVGVDLRVLELVVEKLRHDSADAVPLLRRGVRVAGKHLEQVEQRRPVRAAGCAVRCAGGLRCLALVHHAESPGQTRKASGPHAAQLAKK